MLFFKKSNATNEMDLDSPSTIIGKGTYIEAARMAGGESVRIEGDFKGNIEINGSLVLGDDASVTGDIQATYFLVAGEVNGNISCDTLLHFAGSSRVTGDIHAAALVIDEGAQVCGRYIVSGTKKELASLVDKQEPQILIEESEKNE